MPYTTDLGLLLTPGARYADEDTTYTVEPHHVTDVVLPTGKIVGCDPLAMADSAQAFTVTVPPGIYRLTAWVAVIAGHGKQERDRRVAALQLTIRPEQAVRWDLALTEDQDPAELGDDEFFGYGVDAGTGTLADLAAIQALAEWDFDRLDDVFIPAQLPEKPVPGAIVAVTDEANGGNVATVSSGWGDGCYPTFIGYTAAGEPACFVTDFMVVPEGNEQQSP